MIIILPSIKTTEISALWMSTLILTENPPSPPISLRAAIKPNRRGQQTRKRRGIPSSKNLPDLFCQITAGFFTANDFIIKIPRPSAEVTAGEEKTSPL